MKEVRFHGRGGQGAITAAEILADAIFREGKHSQKIPVYGVERRGAPVMAFMRFDDKPIRITHGIYEPDCVVVLDHMLPRILSVTRGLKKSGIAVLNEPKPPQKVDLGVELSRIATVDATAVAINLLGARAIPLTNTTMLGAFSAATGWVKLESLFNPISERFPGRIGEKNIEAAKMGYERIQVMEC